MAAATASHSSLRVAVLGGPPTAARRATSRRTTMGPEVDPLQGAPIGKVGSLHLETYGSAGRQIR